MTAKDRNGKAIKIGDRVFAKPPSGTETWWTVVEIGHFLKVRDDDGRTDYIDADRCTKKGA